MLPAVYEMDDYRDCVGKRNLYCKVDAYLNRTGEGGETWNLIERSKRDPLSLDRSVLHRAICVPTQYSDFVAAYSKAAVDRSLQHLNLTSTVDNVLCMSDGYTTVSAYDKIVLMTLAAYVCLVVYATMYDWWTRADMKNRQLKGTKIILAFSLLSSWEKIRNPKANADYDNLKAIQGVRFYNMLLVLLLHTIGIYAQMYVSNIEELERMLRIPVISFATHLGMFLVQTFFLISSFLLTVQVYRVFEERGRFSAKQAVCVLLNRYFRLTVTLAVYVAVLKLTFWKALQSPTNFEIYIYNEWACRNHWLAALFLVNNFYYIKDICNPPSWYVSVDFQLYTASMVTLWFILHFRLNTRKVLAALLLISCVFYGLVIYVYDMDTNFKPTLNTIRTHAFATSVTLKTLYLSTYSNWTTSYVGLALGIYYSENKSKSTVKPSKVVSFLWALVFCGLPSIVMLLSQYEYSRMTRAVLGALLKPLFAFGIGVGILGMVRNMGGVIKRICEWRYVVLLSNFTFSTYVCHFLIVFSKGTTDYAPVELGTGLILKSYVSDVLTSLCVGIVVALMIEYPGLTLQKLLLPQAQMCDSKNDQKNK